MILKKTVIYSLAFCAGLSLGNFVVRAEESPSPDSGTYYRQTFAGNYLAGRYAQRNQDWKKAGEYLNRLVAMAPDDQTLNQRAMILAMGSGNYNQAFLLSRKVLDAEPDNMWGNLFVTLEAFAHQDYTNAKKIVASFPQNGITGFVSPIFDVWMKAQDNVLVTEVTDGNPLQLFHAILAAHYMDRTKGLPPDIDEKIKEASFEAHVLEQIADIYALAGLKEKALQYYYDLQSDNPTQAKLEEKITAVENGQSISGLLETKPIASVNEGIAKAMFDLARILYREFNDESAQIFSNMALALDPQMTQAKILLAHIQTRYERYEDAIQYYNSVNENDLAYLPVQHQVADLLDDMGRFEEAEKLLEKLVRVHDDKDALILLGDMYRRHEEFSKSIRIYDRAIRDAAKTKNEDTHWSLYYARGMAHEQTGNWDKARSDLEAALQYKPDNPYLLNYLGYSMADRGIELPKALSMIEKAVSLRPRDGYITDSLGWVYYRMGDFENAVKPLERAVELLPYDPVINDHLGDAYWQVGRKTEARFQWQRAMNHTEDQELITTIENKLREGITTQSAHRDSLSSDAPTLNR